MKVRVIYTNTIIRNINILIRNIKFININIKIKYCLNQPSVAQLKRKPLNLNSRAIFNSVAPSRLYAPPPQPPRHKQGAGTQHTHKPACPPWPPLPPPPPPPLRWSFPRRRPRAAAATRQHNGASRGACLRHRSRHRWGRIKSCRHTSATAATGQRYISPACDSAADATALPSQGRTTGRLSMAASAGLPPPAVSG